MSWGNDPVVEPQKPAWGASDPELPPILARGEEDKARMLPFARKRLGETSFPNALATGVGLGSSVVAPVARALGQDETADRLNRFGQAYEQAAQERDQNGVVPPILMRGIRGAAKTLPTTIVAGAALGPYGAIGTAALQERDQAITEGRDMGLSEPEVQRYAAFQGAIEGSIAAAFQKVGLGGLESTVTRQAASKGLAQALTQAGKSSLQELPEEIVTELWHNVARAVATGDSLTPEQIKDTVLETSVQTLVTMGAAEAPNIVGSGLTGAARGKRLAQLKELRAAKPFISAEDAQAAGITGETRKGRQSNTDSEIKQLEQEIQNEPEVPAEAPVPEVRQAADVQGQVPAGEVAPEGPEVQVDQDIMAAILAAEAAAPEAPKPAEQLAAVPSEQPQPVPAEQPKKRMGKKPPESLPEAPKQELAPEPTPAVPVTPVASQEAEKTVKRRGRKDQAVTPVQPVEPAAIQATADAKTAAENGDVYVVPSINQAKREATKQALGEAGLEPVPGKLNYWRPAKQAEAQPVQPKEPEAEPISAKPAEEKKAPEPFTRRTPPEGSPSREGELRVMQVAREQELALRDKKKPLEAQLKNTRRNAYKKRGEIEKQIRELDKQIGEWQRKFQEHQGKVREASVEDYLEKPDLSETQREDGLAELARTREQWDQASLHEHNVQAAFIQAAQEHSDKLNKDEITAVADRARRDFSVSSRSTPAQIVEGTVKQQLSARSTILRSDARNNLPAEQLKEFDARMAEASKEKDFYEKQAAITDEALAAGKVAAEVYRKEREVQAEVNRKQAEVRAVEQVKENRQRAKSVGREERFWKELSKRANAIKGKKGTVEVVQADKSRVEEKAEILDDKWAITETTEDGKKTFSLIHVPTGLSAVSGTSANVKQFLQLAREAGADFDSIPNVIPEGWKMPAIWGKLRSAWDRSSLYGLPEDMMEKLVGKVSVTPTNVKADLILDSFDLGAHDKKLETHGLAMVKEMAKDVPEFAYEPIFTVNSKKQLVFRDGVTYTLAPEKFNLHPSELTEGQTVGINLEDIGLAQISASEAVSRTLKNFGFSNVKAGENSVSASWGGKRVSMYGKGDKWNVDQSRDKPKHIAAGDMKVAGQSQLAPGPVKMAEQALSKIHFLEGGPGFQKPKTALQQDADTALKEALDEAKSFVNKVGKTLNTGFNPELAAGAARVVLKFARYGTLKFGVMLEHLKNSVGQPAVDKIQNLLELAWDKAQSSGRFPGMEPRVKPTPVQQEQAVEKSQSIDPEDLASIKKAVVNDMREKRGLPEREAPTPETVEQWAEEARITLANDPMAAIRLVNQLESNPVPISERQATLLQFHYRNLENVRNAASEEYFAAVAAEDSARIVNAKTALINASVPMTHFEEAILRPAGTAWSRTGTAFQQMLRKDFSLSAILRKGREANAGKELSEKQTVELAAMAKEMEEIRKKLEVETKLREEAEAKLAAHRQHEQVVKEVKGESVRRNERRQKAEKRVEDAWAAFNKATAGQASAGIPVNLLPHVVELATAYVDLGVVRVGEFLAAAKARLGENLDEYQFRAAWESVAPAVPSLAGFDNVELSVEARRIQRMLVSEGMTDRDQVTQVVHGILQAELPDLTMRQTMDALSRYGIFQVPSKNEVDKILRGMRSELLKMSQIDQQEIALERVEELRAEGKSDEEIGTALQDENLLVAATGLVRDKPTETLRKLTELYNANKASIPSTSGQREGKLSSARNAYETRLKNQIKAYEEILDKGDFSPVPKKPVRTLSDAELKLKRQYDDTRHKVLQKYAEYELAHLSPLGRVWDTVKEVSNLQRALATGFDISPFGRQGGPVAYSHPLLAANVLKEVVTELYRQTNKADIGKDFDWKQLGKFLTGLDTRQAEFNALHDLNDNEQGRFRIEAGLGITSSEEQATRQEEIMSGRWAKHIPGIAGSGRIATMILNKMRATLFDLMVDHIGRGGRVSLDEGKMIAQFVNMATGRADWGTKGNQVLSNLNVAFFSARWVASRFEYLANPFILPFRGGGLKKNWRVKRAIYMEYGRTFGSVSTVLGIVALAGALLWDDDDEDKPLIELDPRSPDFLKIRMGETRLDLMFGLSQVLVLSAQFYTKEKKSSVTGKVRDIGEGSRPKTRLDLLAHFARTKLAPVPGAGVTALNGMENVVGQQETPGSLAGSLLVPISLSGAGKAMQDRGIPQGAALDLLAMAGAGLNTYGPKTQYVYGTQEQREKQIQDDLKYMAWDSTERPAYSEYLTDDQLEQFADRRQEKRGLVIFNATYAGKDPDELVTRDRNLEHLEKMKSEGVALEEARAMLKEYYLRPDSQGKRGSIREKDTGNVKESYLKKQRALTSLYK